MRTADASLYSLDAEALAHARPSVVLTQALCSVCAADASDVDQVCKRLADALPSAPRVVSLSPSTLDEVAESFVTVADACGVRERGVALRDEFRRNLESIAPVPTALRTVLLVADMLCHPVTPRPAPPVDPRTLRFLTCALRVVAAVRQLPL